MRRHRVLRARDFLFFYATRPVSGLIGTGTVIRKVKESEPYWPDEKSIGSVKYPYRIEFKPTTVLNKSDWETRRVSISHLGPIFFGGTNPIRSKDLSEILTNLVTQI